MLQGTAAFIPIARSKGSSDAELMIEGTISQMVCALDMRRSRYIGRAKTHLQHVLTATAINLIRAGAWLEEIPFAKTRRSPFAVLRAAWVSCLKG
ncbi:MAG TPA: transposase [Ktedonobacteraceae bacterium]|nr:transposase [Ktedonobacteraceae bacterium]